MTAYQSLRATMRHCEPPSGGAGDWVKKELSPTRHRELPSGGAGDWAKKARLSALLCQAETPDLLVGQASLPVEG